MVFTMRIIARATPPTERYGYSITVSITVYSITVDKIDRRPRGIFLNYIMITN